jgi:hypothetical protein
LLAVYFCYFAWYLSAIQLSKDLMKYNKTMIQKKTLLQLIVAGAILDDEELFLAKKKEAAQRSKRQAKKKGHNVKHKNRKS